MRCSLTKRQWWTTLPDSQPVVRVCNPAYEPVDAILLNETPRRNKAMSRHSDSAFGQGFTSGPRWTAGPKRHRTPTVPRSQRCSGRSRPRSHTGDRASFTNVTDSPSSSQKTAWPIRTGHMSTERYMTHNVSTSSRASCGSTITPSPTAPRPTATSCGPSWTTSSGRTYSSNASGSSMSTTRPPRPRSRIRPAGTGTSSPPTAATCSEHRNRH